MTIGFKINNHTHSMELTEFMEFLLKEHSQNHHECTILTVSSDEEFNQLVLAIFKLQNPISLTLKHSNPDYNNKLNDLEAVLKDNELRTLSSPIAAQTKDSKKRKAKIHMVQGNDPNKINLQMSQQQQQQQQPQPKDNANARKKREIKVDDSLLNNNNAATQFEPDTSDPLINGDTIAAAFAGQETEQELKKIWDNLVGEGASQITNYQHKITHATPDALRLIMRHKKEFQYGISFHNLPPGFYLEQREGEINVLCYSPTKALLQEPNPLTLELVTPAPKILKNSFKSLLLVLLKQKQPPAKDSSILNAINNKFEECSNEFPDMDLSQFSSQFDNLSAAEFPIRKQALEYFITVLGTEDLQSQIDKLDLNEDQYQGVISILIHEGISGLKYFANQMDELNNQNAYKSFNKLFLHDANNFQQLVTHPGIDLFKRLSHYDGAKKSWFLTLVEQHQAAGNRVDFNELAGAFDYFLRELEALGVHQLPPVCPFQDVRHMKSGLDRLLYILKYTSSAKEQLNYVSDFNLGPNAAYFAVRFNRAQLVFKEMQPNPLYMKTHEYGLTNADLENAGIELPATEEEVKRLNRSNFIAYLLSLPEDNVSPEIVRRYYYRCIATAENCYTVEQYRIFEKMILEQKLSAKETTVLLLLVAIISTSPIKEANNFQADLELLLENRDILNDLNEYFLINIVHLSQETPLLQTLNLQEIIDLANTANNIMLHTHQNNNKDHNKVFITNMVELLKIFKLNKPLMLQFIKNIETRADVNAEERHVRFELQLTFINNYINTLANYSDNEELFRNILFLVQNVATSVEMTSKTEINDFFKALCNCDKENAQLTAILIDLLKDINIEKSDKIPNFIDLKRLVDHIANIDWGHNKTDQQVKQELMDFLSLNLPATRFGNQPISKIKTNLPAAVKAFWTKSKPNVKLKKFFADDSTAMYHLSNLHMKNYVLKVTQEMRDKFDNLDKIMDRTPLPGDEPILNALEEIETALGKIMIMRVGLNKLSDFLSPLLGEIVKYAGGKTPITAKDMQNYIQTLNLIQLMQYDIRDTFYNGIKNFIVLSLQLETNHTFIDFCQRLLGQLNTTKHIKQSVEEYGKKYITVISLINLIIDIKNSDHSKGQTDFKSLIDTMSKLGNPKSNQIFEVTDVDTPNPEYLLEIMELLSPCSTKSRSQELSIIYNALYRDNRTIEANIKTRAFRELKILISLKERFDQKDGPLSINDYLKLLEISFKYNLSASTAAPAFPLDTLMQLLPATDKPEDAKLFNEFVTFIKNTQAIPAKLVTESITNISNILGNNQHPKIRLLLVTLMGLGAGTQTNFELLNEFLKGIPQPQSPEWLTIMSTAVANKDTTIADMVAFQKTLQPLQNNESFMVKLANLFQYPPVPSLKQVMNNINTEEQLINFTNKLDKDPFQKRINQQFIDKQFSTENIGPVILDLVDILEQSPLSRAEQHALAQKLTYINAIGRDAPLKIGETQLLGLTNVSRADLRQFSNILIADIRDIDKAQDKVINQLKLIAVMREAYYRTTGRLPYTTQILALLLSLQYPRNIIMQINTGEGKSIITALLAVLQWTEGGTIDVATANRQLASNDYKENKAFFNLMGIDSSKVLFESDAGTYQIGGINYSTVPDLALYFSRAKVEHENTTEKNGVLYRKHLVLDEFDHIVFDLRVEYKYAVGTIDGGNSSVNPYEWIYPLVNQFIDKKEFKDISSPDAWSVREDAEKLRVFLYERSDSDQRKKLSDIADAKLDKWIDAACSASQLVEKQNYLVGEENRQGNVVKIAIPLVQNSPQKSSTYSDGVQQFLHARLVVEKQLYFPIDAEMVFIDSLTANDFVSNYHHNGRLQSISGSAGTIQELEEQRSKFGTRAIKLPPHQKNMREMLVTRIAQSSDKHKEAVVTVLQQEGIINTTADTQPVLIICKDIGQATEMYEYISGMYPNKKVRIATGENEQELTEQIEHAGDNDTITISTSILGRGTDIKVAHRKGLMVVQTYLDTARATTQIIGRAARNGQLGTYVAVYEENSIIHHTKIKSLKKMKPEAREEVIRDMQIRLNTEGAMERHYTQAMSNMQQVLLEQLELWFEILEQNFEESPRALDKLRLDMLKHKETLLTQLVEKWKNLTPIPLIQLQENGAYNTADLDQALVAFQENANELWNNIKETLIETYEPIFNDEAKIRIGFAMQIKIDEEIKLRKLHINKKSSQDKNDNQLSLNIIEFALNEADAVCAFSPDIDAPLLDKYKNQASNYCLNVMLKQLNTFSENKHNFTKVQKDSDKINQLFSMFESLANHKVNLSSVYPTLNQFIAYCNTNFVADEALTTRLSALTNEYKTQIARTLMEELEPELSWAHSKGIWYWLRSKEIRNTGVSIWNSLEELNTAPITTEKFQELYKNLLIQKPKMQQKLGFFGYAWKQKQMLRLVNRAIAQLEDIKAVAELTPTAVKLCKEQALRSAYMNSFDKLWFNIGKRYYLKQQGAIDVLGNAFKTIKSDNNTIFVFEELLHTAQQYLKDHKPEDKSVVKVVRYLQKIVHEISTQNTDIYSSNTYIEASEALLKEKFASFTDVSTEDLVLQSAHDGVRQYYELRVKGKNFDAHPVFKEFTSYQTTIANLQSEKDKLEEKQSKLYIDFKNVREVIMQSQNALSKTSYMPIPLPYDHIEPANAYAIAINNAVIIYNNAIKAAGDNQETKAHALTALSEALQTPLLLCNQQMTSLVNQINAIDNIVAREQDKKAVRVKEFATAGELFDFIARVRTMEVQEQIIDVAVDDDYAPMMKSPR